ncbi:MAG: imidazole glycerol phosphate synthase subunit HisH [Solirubrobacterales bacterium]
MIAILDYGMGNLRSVEKALEKVGADAARTSDLGAASEADGLILPGVGAFPEAMRRIRERGMDDVIRERAGGGVPVLGICLGMQLLFDGSSELGGAEGLGLIGGDVSVLDAGGAKVPHIGWAPVLWAHHSSLTTGIESGDPFYFVHTFVPRPADDDVLGTATYGERFACAVERNNVFGFQFHPEKSSGAGLRLLENFAAICVPIAA